MVAKEFFFVAMEFDPWPCPCIEGQILAEHFGNMKFLSIFYCFEKFAKKPSFQTPKTVFGQ